MKKVSRLTAVVVFMLISSLGFANAAKYSLRVGAQKSLIFKVDAQSETTDIKLTDIDGNLIYAEDLEDIEVYRKRFDLRNLQKGDFFFTVENELKRIIYTIAITEDAAKIVNKTERAKPVFTARASKVYLNMLNLKQDTVTIKIFDSSNRLVFEETISEQLNLTKVFNFEKAVQDDYTIVVEDNSDTFIKGISVQ